MDTGPGFRTPGCGKSSNMARIGTKLSQNAFQTIPDVSFFDAEKNFLTKISDRNFRFLLIWPGFWRATAKRTSKSASGSIFALDRLILRSVRPNIVKNTMFEDFPNPGVRNPGPVSDRCHRSGSKKQKQQQQQQQQKKKQSKLFSIFLNF